MAGNVEWLSPVCQGARRMYGGASSVRLGFFTVTTSGFVLTKWMINGKLATTSPNVFFLEPSQSSRDASGVRGSKVNFFYELLLEI